VVSGVSSTNTGCCDPMSCFQLVKLMGGDVSLQNRSDGHQGCVFCFEIPLGGSSPLPCIEETATKGLQSPDDVTMLRDFEASSVARSGSCRQLPRSPVGYEAKPSFPREKSNDVEVASPPGFVPDDVHHPLDNAKPRVLIVDDESANRRLCLRMLNKLGCTAEALEDGDQVLPRLLRDAGDVSPYDSRQVFDMILMDIMMQRTNVSTVQYGCVGSGMDGVIILIVVL
jgi:CheY-like chemotaxis protein